ncbi:UNVERIFIED_CONTAM: hypothetical protein K2H54_058846, partial [Gekko kuhli]
MTVAMAQRALPCRAGPVPGPRHATGAAVTGPPGQRVLPMATPAGVGLPVFGQLPA